jgi:prolyl-tRNA synthetase
MLVRTVTLAYNLGHMRYTDLFIKTVRDVPGRVRSPSYRLLVQGGFIRPVGKGLFSFTPLGLRVIRNIESIIREEMERLGGQEVLLPVVSPREVWSASGRDVVIDRDMVCFRDRNGKELVLSPTHEEAMVEFMRHGAQSYRDLPKFLYQFQTKFRDESKTRCGLVRAREFVMKDAYSFHRSFADLNGFFPKVFAGYSQIFRRCGLNTVAAEAGVGYMGGQRSYEFLMPSDCGDDYLVSCDSCSYAANEEVAIGVKTGFPAPLQTIQEVEVPEKESLTAVRQSMDIPPSEKLKAMLYRTENSFAMAVVRGDQAVSEEKLSSVIGAAVVGPAVAEQLQDLGLHGPWLSPFNLSKDCRSKITVVIDDACAETSNMLAGTNEPGRVCRNVNFGRDFEADHIEDITRIPVGATCRHCGKGTLQRVRAMELGNIFRLGDYYTRRMDYWVREENGGKTFPHMGSYGIGLGRLMSAVVDIHHDDRGIIWPPHIAPFSVFLMSIGKSLSVRDVAESIYSELGDTVLYDDRRESISHKLKDGDLLGIPVRIIVSRDAVQEGFVEVAVRSSGETRRVHRDALASTIKTLVEEIELV